MDNLDLELHVMAMSKEFAASGKARVGGRVTSR